MPNIRSVKKPFINFTDFEDREAKSIVGELTKLVQRAESDRQPNLERAERGMEIWKNEFWSEEDLEIWDDLDVYPHQIPEARAPINNLVSQQRNQRFAWDVVPLDKQSYERFKKGRNKFVEENMEDFDSVKQAREYYDQYYDDEYAKALTTYLDFIRNMNNTSDLEGESFENGIITGLHFLKTIWKGGEIKTEGRSQRSMFYDISSVQYDLSDIEYIGEVHLLYKQDLIEQYPDKADIINQHFERTDNFLRNGQTQSEHWKEYYEFSNGQNQDLKIKIVELWYKDIEERFKLVDSEKNETRLLRHDLSEDQVMDMLASQTLENLKGALLQGELSPEFFDRPMREVKTEIQDMVNERYSLFSTNKQIWRKVVFTHNGLLENMRSPLPHESHPYTAFFPQFTDGWNTGLIDDVHDVLLALNKAVAFREVLMAHSAKGAVVIDRDTVTQSNYSMDDIKALWTQVGGVIDLKLKGNRRLQDVFQQVNTMAQGLSEINVVISDLERRLYRILGVNQAQLGMSSDEASGRQDRQRIVQGQANNGRIFDNFNRTLRLHTHEKVIPLAMFDLLEEKPSAIRLLGDNHTKWLEIDYNDDFDLFAEAIFTGKYKTKLMPKDSDKQSNTLNTSMLLELAGAGVINIETAFEFADNFPNSHEIIKRDKEITRQKMREQASQQVSIQRLQQLLLENPNISAEQADEMIKKVRVEQMEKQRTEEESQTQGAQGMREIQREAQQGRAEQGQDNQ